MNQDLPPINNRALLLFSGGLDSILAAKLMTELGVEILALNFQSPFYNQPAARDRAKTQPLRTAEEYNIPYRIITKGLDFLEILERPRHGFGKNANPCIDCKIYMMIKARQIMIEEDFSFLVTGEVLGQRPMSQRLDTFGPMEKQAGLAGRILRPLCAGKLKPTEPEIAGVVDRDRLWSIVGRNRKIQMEQAALRNIEDYPSPAGGCLLTDELFSAKLRHLMQIKPGYNYTDIHLLKLGRHIRLGDRTKVVVTRNETETNLLGHLKPAGTWYFTPGNFSGPDALLVGPSDAALRLQVAEIIVRYGKKPEEGPHLVEAGYGQRRETHQPQKPFEDRQLRSMMNWGK